MYNITGLKQVKQLMLVHKVQYTGGVDHLETREATTLSEDLQVIGVFLSISKTLTHGRSQIQIVRRNTPDSECQLMIKKISTTWPTFFSVFGCVISHYCSSYNPYSLWCGEVERSVFESGGSSVVAFCTTKCFHPHDGY